MLGEGFPAFRSSCDVIRMSRYQASIFRSGTKLESSIATSQGHTCSHQLSHRSRHDDTFLGNYSFSNMSYITQLGHGIKARTRRYAQLATCGTGDGCHSAYGLVTNGASTYLVANCAYLKRTSVFAIVYHNEMSRKTEIPWSGANQNMIYYLLVKLF